MPLWASVAIGVGTASAGVYDAHTTNSFNERVRRDNLDRDRRAYEFEQRERSEERQDRAADRRQREQQWRAELALAERRDRDQLRRERERWQAYVQANQPYWETSAAAYNALRESLGLPPASAPPMFPGGAVPPGENADERWVDEVPTPPTRTDEPPPPPVPPVQAQTPSRGRATAAQYGVPSVSRVRPARPGPVATRRTRSLLSLGVMPG